MAINSSLPETVGLHKSGYYTKLTVSLLFIPCNRNFYKMMSNSLLNNTTLICSHTVLGPSVHLQHQSVNSYLNVNIWTMTILPPYESINSYNLKGIKNLLKELVIIWLKQYVHQIYIFFFYSTTNISEFGNLAVNNNCIVTKSKLNIVTVLRLLCILKHLINNKRLLI